MVKAKSSVARRKRRKRFLRQAQGYRGGRGRLYRTARESVEKGLMYSFRDRRRKKGDFRRLWVSRINAGARESGISYSKLIHGLSKANISLDRKILAELAVSDAETFSQLVGIAKEELKGK